MKEKKVVKRGRKSENLKIAPANFLIICEGIQTEPNYFNGLKHEINKKYGRKVDVLIPSIDVKGTGMNTVSLINYAKRVVNQANKMYGQVWVVFDKDDYADKQFNAAIQECDYNVAWSNPNFELWLLAHLKRVTRYISKDEILKELEKEFRKNGLGEYQKSDDEIFEKLAKDGKIHIAIENCKQMEKLTKENKKCSEKNPTTMVYKIVENLEEYL